MNEATPSHAVQNHATTTTPGPDLASLLEAVRTGEMSIADAETQLRLLGAGHPDRSLSFATIDDSRKSRCGSPEVIYGQGKTADEIVAIARGVLARESSVLITRIKPEDFAAVRSALGAEHPCRQGTHSRCLLAGTPPESMGVPIPIVTAGTSDGAVAEEAELTCVAMGCVPERINDVGVAGLHRLVDRLAEVRRGEVVITIAGMEAALPSVIGGLVDAPVIAVPTSVGYGAHFGGLAALLGCLNSCSSGVSVVNIDNGFGAALIACRINRLAATV